jgi:hypothetical protein
MSDGIHLYTWAGQVLASHEIVQHSHNEYVRGDVHTKAHSQFSSGHARRVLPLQREASAPPSCRADFRYNNRVA